MRNVMTSVVIAVFIGTSVLLIVKQLDAADSILVCTFSHSAFFGPKGQDDVSAEIKKEKPWTVVFAEIDSDSPKLKGNVGESTLTVLRRNSNTVWLAEAPPLGGVNVWTIFFDTHIAIYSKQYPIWGKPFGMMSMGRCK